MQRNKWVIIVLNLVLVLAYYHYSIIKKEEILQDGKLVFLELAPVDPRSLIQGDYMDLNYRFSDTGIMNLPKRGYVVVHLDQQDRAMVKRFQQSKIPLSKDEYLIQYSKKNDWNIHIGAESYFFEEGKATKYGQAQYGGLRIDKEGNSLLIGLYDSSLHRIE